MCSFLIQYVIDSPPVLSFQSLPSLPNTSSPSQLHVPFLFFKSTEFSWCCWYVSGYRVTCRGTGKLPRARPQKKTDISPPAPITANSSSAEWDFVTPSPTHLGILTGLVLRRSCACSHSHCEWAPCPEDIFFAAVPPTSGSDSLSTASSVMVPELWWRSRNTDVLFRGEYFRVSYYLWSNQLWISILNSIYCKKKKKFLWGYEGARKWGPKTNVSLHIYISLRMLYNLLWS